MYALRGATASGKSSLARKKIQKDLSGSLNPDHMKQALKTLSRLNHRQVHEEVVKGPLSSYKEEVLKRKTESIILDTRLSSLEDFGAVIQAASVRGKGASVIDLDVSLQTSLQRTLKRDPFGPDPSVDPQSVQASWIEVRRARPGIIEIVKNSPHIDFYQLYYNDDKGNHLVAEKQKGVFRVFSKELFALSQTVSSNEEMERDLQQLVTFGRWKNIPLATALLTQSLCAPVSRALLEIERLKLFGTVKLEPFTGEWLKDFPQIKEHLDAEHRLHIMGADDKGRGLHYETNKFASTLNPRFNPEASQGFQMRLGYFLVPASLVEVLKTVSLSSNVLEQLEVKDDFGRLAGYRLFVHPEAYTHFQSLHDMHIPFVKPEDSQFIGTPTSSYRSWALRCMEGSNPKPNSVPFIVKLGVGESARLLSSDEVKRSIQVQAFFETQKKQADLVTFPETFGLILNREEYSGLLIREFPEELLKGDVQIVNCSALMSVERKVPLIFDVMEATIKKGLTTSPLDFIEKFFVTGFFKAFTSLMFEEKLSLALHGQNLCFVLNKDLTPKGFAIRDFGDIYHMKRYVETYSWFYRYHVFIKLMNVVTSFDKAFLPAPIGAPIQMGHSKPLKERNLNHYLESRLTGISLRRLERLSISFDQYNKLLDLLDNGYVTLLSRTFGIVLDKIPAAEIGSSGQEEVTKLNRKLFNSLK